MHQTFQCLQQQVNTDVFICICNHSIETNALYILYTVLYCMHICNTDVFICICNHSIETNALYILYTVLYCMHICMCGNT